MPLLAISLLISTLFGAVLHKNVSNTKQPISHRRHNSKSGLLDINKDLSV
jgi:hypothetical protein